METGRADLVCVLNCCCLHVDLVLFVFRDPQSKILSTPTQLPKYSYYDRAQEENSIQKPVVTLLSGAVQLIQPLPVADVTLAPIFGSMGCPSAYNIYTISWLWCALPEMLQFFKKHSSGKRRINCIPTGICWMRSCMLVSLFPVDLKRSGSNQRNAASSAHSATDVATRIDRLSDAEKFCLENESRQHYAFGDASEGNLFVFGIYNCIY